MIEQIVYLIPAAVLLFIAGLILFDIRGEIEMGLTTYKTYRKVVVMFLILALAVVYLSGGK